MQLFDPNNPNEKKKMIAAAVLGVAAIAVLGYVFFGGSSATPTNGIKVVRGPSPTPNRVTQGPPPDSGGDDASRFDLVVYNPNAPALSEADRNIFAYYEPTPRPSPLPYVPTPTPAPPIPIQAMPAPIIFAAWASMTELLLSCEVYELIPASVIRGVAP